MPATPLKTLQPRRIHDDIRQGTRPSESLATLGLSHPTKTARPFWPPGALLLTAVYIVSPRTALYDGSVGQAFGFSQRARCILTMTTSKICAAGDAPVRPWVENECTCNLDSIALWTVCLDRDKPSVEGLYRLLSPNERARADRFRFAVDQTRYIVRRGLLRTVLGRSLAVEPGDLVFRNGEFGKPFLSDCSRPRLAFNVSHSNGMAVFAISGC